MELATAARIAEARAPPAAVRAQHRLAVQHLEARVVELAERRVQIVGMPGDGDEAAAPVPLRRLTAQRGAQLRVVGGAVHFPLSPPHAHPGGGVGQRLGNDVDHAADGVRPVQQAGGPPDDFDALGEPRVHGGPVLVVPRVARRGVAVVQYQDARPG